MRKRTLINRFSDRRVLAASILILAAIIVLLARVFNHSGNSTTLIPSSGPLSNTTSSKEKSSGTQPSTPTGSNNPSSKGSSTTSTTSSSGSTSLISPFGGFVSNHSPSLSNTSLQSESSVCNTTPNAKCYIKFTQGSNIKQLAAKAADSTGAVYWFWNVKSAGLSTGDWTITAVATLNGQTKSTQDNILLSVQP